MTRSKHSTKRTSRNERCLAVAKFMLDKKTTIRKAAAKFGISKSTAHSDLTVILPEIDRALYEEVRKLLDLNWNERYYRGGRATKRKYAGQCKINLVSAIATLNKSSQREASV